MIGIAIKLALIFRVAVFVFDMRTQQMNDDQFLRRRVLQHFLEMVSARWCRIHAHSAYVAGSYRTVCRSASKNTVSMVLRAVIVCSLVIQKVL